MFTVVILKRCIYCRLIFQTRYALCDAEEEMFDAVVRCPAGGIVRVRVEDSVCPSCKEKLEWIKK